MNDMKFLVDLINNGVPIVFGSIDQKHHNSKTKKWWFLITTIINTAILLTIDVITNVSMQILEQIVE